MYLVFWSEFQLIHELCLYILSISQWPELIRETLSTLHAFLSWIPLGYIFESPLVCISSIILVFLCMPDCLILCNLNNGSYLYRLNIGTLNVLRIHLFLVFTMLSQFFYCCLRLLTICFIFVTVIVSAWYFTKLFPWGRLQKLGSTVPNRAMPP